MRWRFLHLIGYEGDKLASFQASYWRVKVRDNHGRESEWSQLLVRDGHSEPLAVDR